jgi:hypothetical protein
MTSINLGKEEPGLTIISILLQKLLTAAVIVIQISPRQTK